MSDYKNTKQDIREEIEVTKRANEYKELNFIYLMKDILYFTKNTIIFYILIFEFYLLPSYANIYERATSFCK